MRDGLVAEVYDEEKKVKLALYYDDMVESPREWDNIGTMICSHREYKLGDEQVKTENYSSWYEVIQDIIEENDDEVYYLPLYIYNHGVITINTTGFSCHWDSGQVGWIYVTKGDVLDIWKATQERNKDNRSIEDYAYDILRREVKTYDNYVLGNCYEVGLYQINKCKECGHVSEEIIYSCGGYIEDNLSDLIDRIGYDIGRQEYGHLLNLLEEKI